MKNRTGINFDEHELKIIKDDNVTIYQLKKPDTIYQSIKFINTQGIMAVTGDYGNWIFCREFHPKADGKVSDGYWAEKLTISSSQEVYVFDNEGTRKQLKDGINGQLAEYGYEGEELEEAKAYFKHLLDFVDDYENEYVNEAYNNMPRNFDFEMIPLQKRLKPWLMCIFDGFDEICNRIKEDVEV